MGGHTGVWMAQQFAHQIHLELFFSNPQISILRARTKISLPPPIYPLTVVCCCIIVVTPSAKNSSSQSQSQLVTQIYRCNVKWLLFVVRAQQQLTWPVILSVWPPQKTFGNSNSIESAIHPSGRLSSTTASFLPLRLYQEYPIDILVCFIYFFGHEW